MRKTNPNTYIQYVNENGHVKTVEIDREVEATEIIYTTPPITENFFILSLFDLNQRVYGLTFGNYQNLEGLGFLNSEFQTLEALPPSGFFPANTEVSIVKDTNEYDINFNVLSVGQKTNERLFLEDYCREHFPENPFVIVPVFEHISEDNVFSMWNEYELFFCCLNGSENISLNNMRGDFIPIPYLATKGYNLFTHFQRLDYILPFPNFGLWGYKAIFQDKIWNEQR